MDAPSSIPTTRGCGWPLGQVGNAGGEREVGEQTQETRNKDRLGASQELGAGVAAVSEAGIRVPAVCPGMCPG